MLNSGHWRRYDILVVAIFVFSRYLQTSGDLRKWRSDGGTEHVLGLFAPSHMDYEPDREAGDGGQPSLTEMTEAAVEHLSRAPAGFFLMVESGRIDHAHHDNSARRALEETLEFERAVQVGVYRGSQPFLFNRLSPSPPSHRRRCPWWT